MKPILFSLPGSEAFTAQLRQTFDCQTGTLDIHQFPDGESCPRLVTPVNGRKVILVAALDRPDAKILPLYLSACVARELGAISVGLVIPYLPYMRQDARFHDGEGITSLHIARLLASCCDWLTTVDPHLHRHHDLSALYGIPTRVVHAAPALAAWIAAHVERPLLIGPDEESRQWVGDVAARVGCGFAVMEKVRSGDRQVAVSLDAAQDWRNVTPVLVDDIVSTARTMAAAAREIIAGGAPAPVCVAVHPLFAGDALAALQDAGVHRIASCNTITHATNQIDICGELGAAITELLAAPML